MSGESLGGDEQPSRLRRVVAWFMASEFGDNEEVPDISTGLVRGPANAAELIQNRTRPASRGITDEGESKRTPADPAEI